MHDPKRCAVLVPYLGAIDPETHQCLGRLIEKGYPVRTLRGCSQIDFARSILATDALRDGFTETLWVDSDVVFDPADVEKLRGHELPLVAGLYPKKGRPEFAVRWMGAGSFTMGVGGGLVPVRYAGMGFVHVRKHVYDRIEKVCGLPRCAGTYDPAKDVVPYFLPLVANEDGKPHYFSEDAAFFHRAAAAGVPAVADTTVRLGHAGRYTYTWSDLLPRQEVESLNLTVEEQP